MNGEKKEAEEEGMLVSFFLRQFVSDLPCWNLFEKQHAERLSSEWGFNLEELDGVVSGPFENDAAPHANPFPPSPLHIRDDRCNHIPREAYVILLGRGKGTTQNGANREYRARIVRWFPRYNVLKKCQKRAFFELFRQSLISDGYRFDKGEDEPPGLQEIHSKIGHSFRDLASKSKAASTQ